MATLQGKKAVILGGSRGIGKAIVERFAREGADVTFTYAGSEDASRKLAQETGSTTTRVDNANRKELTDFIHDQGEIDILVVSAGLFMMGDPLEQEADAVDRLIDVNVRAPYHAAVEAARKMPDGGRIVVVGSVNADRMPMPGGAAYALSKAAIKGMVQGLARDFGERNITVNNVQPGPTDTEMNPADGPYSDVMHSFMALKRHGRPEEVAGVVAFLSGPEAAFITGSHYDVDGGFKA